MPDIVFGTGTTATIKDEPSGTATALDNLISVGGNESVIAFGDITALADDTLKKRPARIDPGTVQFTFFLDDTATATNQLTTLKTKRDSKQKVTIAVDLPGSMDATTKIISYTGYLSSVGNPEVAASDEALRYTVGLQVTA